ncbi:MAG: NTP transferase domain-containing protein [Methanotrichaceae archaeon]|nr:NTP transferase domain-containing protein [Methanotrichaceae archaeon]
MGEKPMVKLLGRRLIDYVATALEDSSVERIFVAATDSVPHTKEWAIERGLVVVDTPGVGFVADMVSGVEAARIKGPVLVIMADLPLITADLIDEIIGVYEERPEPALSTHTPISLHGRLGRRPDSLFNYMGQLIVPAGINVLDGTCIKDEQEDYHLILERMELAVNVNTAEDLKLCEKIMLGDMV